MKKTALLFLFSALLICCSPDDEQNAMVNVLVPVTSVDLPESFTEGETYRIEMTYSPPSKCHEFSGLEADIEDNEIFVGVMNAYSPNDSSCEEEHGLTRQTSFSFMCEPNDFYIFNFWRGQKGGGDPQFLTVEVPVLPATSENTD